MEMVKVSRAPIIACLTCPLCSSLLEEATTISECLHSFCRDCIHLKLSDDDAQSCPICDVYLGVAPLEKLRPDPQLDEVRNKLFHMTTRRRVTSGGSPSSPRKRKERSLSSLGLLSAPSSSARRRTTTARPQYYARTSTKDISSSDYESEPEDDDKSDSSDSDIRRPSREDKGKAVAAGYQSPLAYLAELADADGGRSGRPSSSGVAKDGSDGGRRYTRPSRPTKGAVRRRPGEAGKKLTTSQAQQQITTAVWFALKPADNQDLPPISTPYLRITDGRLPVSLVKKYLATKLELPNETDVELTCRGQPVVSSLPLENVQKIWLTRPRQENAPEASSVPNAQQFLLTLTYARKVKHPFPQQKLQQQQQQDSVTGGA